MMVQDEKLEDLITSHSFYLKPQTLGGKKHEGVKVSRIHPLSITNICTKFKSNLSRSASRCSHRTGESATSSEDMKLIHHFLFFFFYSVFKGNGTQVILSSFLCCANCQVLSSGADEWAEVQNHFSQEITLKLWQSHSNVTWRNGVTY